MQKYGELLRTLLAKRGITDEAQAEIFLEPDYQRDLHDPFLMRDMEKACVRLFEAIDNNEKIVIYADYDCDGIPGAVILQDLFREIKYTNYEVYIPQRNSEGYGLNLDAVKDFANSNVKLIITIDLGITAVAEVAQAEVDGIDIIITDHHLPRQSESNGGLAFNLPRAYAILNPKVDNYPEKMLCGAGVMFKFVQGFLKKYGEYFKVKEGVEKWMLDMAGVATLSDMVPLVGENRALAYFGMKVLRKSPRPGLQKLLAKLNIEQKYLSEDDLGFMVTPRLNAASRMDDPMRAFELLSTDDEVQAEALVKHLSRINDERKSIVTGIMRDVNKNFDKRQMNEVIVIGNPAWRVGVLGLVAGKICDEYQKPVFVWGKDENECIKGSCRSDGSVSVVELMTASSESFIDFGGHELAGGFTVENEKIHFLEEALSLSFTKVQRPKKENVTSYDIKSDLSIVNMKNWREIEKLVPFGLANPKPVFLFEGVKIENIKKFGKNGSGEHLEIIFSDVKKSKAKAISFFSNIDSFKNTLSEGLKLNLLATFDLSRFRGREELRLRIIDIL
ncbi:single-stranded-DNA-specific exonuclease RecJ [Candidatus Nomurabacteria bacterium RIFCSPLOWO2_02_40_28]|uniref:Single-stranded-DNA-specific exonuclease RecJ n=2 Tax=Candidatus Nomuraibacteriota TaxID=1752729 RepID=A0A837I273_9BACT|nr:MAG: Single-stranded-DNA-specific exonuclease RecJ [Candidatus Nomurabacteria bacterium GW2011_GWD2_39_12]KKR20787.1 MAG: Single-stranded-DNA-specific exonuclease RecJ [Candidatus Nomurabacteria bacterium GW2011_GWC2_39_41]KKR36895.1 MAG: Single-stranded-DNA-specific exonuclease RecJ [Candidatus Nomurabacteria bacterium GW2011_GWE2_40_10]KKR38532.1 MAG: Single-stranded-DNA-specific exonuclease RecJ [Candidatus Nomurabacteria bacterium GW2011_GWB1_40_11]KKR39681.1 MAG: Single-stranded-DNA-spe